MFPVKHFYLLPDTEVHENVVKDVIRGYFTGYFGEGVLGVSQVNGDELTTES